MPPIKIKIFVYLLSPVFGTSISVFSNSKPYTESISSIKVPSTSTPLSFISSFTILSDNSYPDGEYVVLLLSLNNL